MPDPTPTDPYDALRAENTRLRAFIGREITQHMRFGILRPDGTTEMLPCADWCYACRLEEARRERDELRDQLRRTRIELDHWMRVIAPELTEQRDLARATAVALEQELAALHEGEEPHEHENTEATPAQWIWLWNRATPQERCALAARTREDAAVAMNCRFAHGYLRERSEAAEARRDELATLLGEVLNHFVHKGHPGESCLSSGWVRVSTVEKWRAALHGTGGHARPDTTSGPSGHTPTCDASASTGLTSGPIGPCILRRDHDGPVHQAADGAKWWEHRPANELEVAGGVISFPPGFTLTTEQADAIRAIFNRAADKPSGPRPDTP